MRKNCREFAQELAEYVFHSKRLLRLCNEYNLDLEKYFNIV
jgi:hypothetical protein